MTSAKVYQERLWLQTAQQSTENHGKVGNAMLNLNCTGGTTNCAVAYFCVEPAQ
ncbi:Protein CBG23652 [Caenorhabditis briggsae]|uniref:Protein CBG11626 n=1 Tax=Caenorhabditis briggsae TaxID=6238 RepID=G2J661_CAEBR|nr:Protein CBG11626 [Caenorhabditis briggsae]XP_002647856.1 Protein CBG23652 [Caenorhabditis briggsae]CAP20453.1 Protein CBG23652 [Caenorhabditis briggsae]CAP30754.1 Protein CBG11626 [Caenorhabditis briggsae]